MVQALLETCCRNLVCVQDSGHTSRHKKLSGGRLLAFRFCPGFWERHIKAYGCCLPKKQQSTPKGTWRSSPHPHCCCQCLCVFLTTLQSFSPVCHAPSSLCFSLCLFNFFPVLATALPHLSFLLPFNAWPKTNYFKKQRCLWVYSTGCSSAHSTRHTVITRNGATPPACLL